MVVTFGSRVNLLRRYVPDLSLREVDRLAGLREGRTQQFVVGSRVEPRRETAVKIAAVFGVSWVWLLEGAGKPPPP